MKIATTIIAVALAFSPAYSTSTSIAWGEDSASAFNLTVAGTGIPCLETFYFVYNGELIGKNGSHNIFEESFASPSGLWNLGAKVDVLDWGGPGVGDLILRHTSISATFLGLSSVLAMDGRFDFGSGPFSEWNGSVTYLVTSMLDYRDPETWDWVLNIAGHGPELHSVPESGGIICLAFATGLLLFFRPKEEWSK